MRIHRLFNAGYAVDGDSPYDRAKGQILAEWHETRSPLNLFRPIIVERAAQLDTIQNGPPCSSSRAVDEHFVAGLGLAQ